VISDGELTIAESGAIVEYLAGKYGDGKLVPAAGTPERLRYTYWVHFAEGSAMPPLLMKLIFDRMETGPMPFFAKPIARAIARKGKSTFVQPNIDRILDYMEGELGKHPWFPPGSGIGARRAGREAAEALGIPEEHPRASRLPARARKRRQIRAVALKCPGRST